jgi:uncharacterized membrane protein
MYAEDTYIYTRAFLVLDVLFSIVFTLAVWLEHTANILLVILLLVTLLSYYPLISYVYDSNKKQCFEQQPWHHDNEYRATLYVSLRFLSLITLVLSSVLVAADVHIAHVLYHMSIKLSIPMFICTLLFIFLCFPAWILSRLHMTRSRSYKSQSKSQILGSQVLLVPGNEHSQSAKDITQRIHKVDKNRIKEKNYILSSNQYNQL